MKLHNTNRRKIKRYRFYARATALARRGFLSIVGLRKLNNYRCPPEHCNKVKRRMHRSGLTFSCVYFASHTHDGKSRASESSPEPAVRQACVSAASMKLGYFFSFNLFRITRDLIISRYSHHGDPSSIPGRVTGFSHVGIVPDDAVGRWIFSGISRFPRLFIPVPLHTHHISPSSALKTALSRAAQISSLAFRVIKLHQARLSSLYLRSRSRIHCFIGYCHSGTHSVSPCHVLWCIINTELDVLGRTLATLKESACPPSPKGPDNPLNLLRTRDWELQLFPMNEEFPVSASQAELQPRGLQHGGLPQPKHATGALLSSTDLVRELSAGTTRTLHWYALVILNEAGVAPLAWELPDPSRGELAGRGPLSTTSRKTAGTGPSLTPGWTACARKRGCVATSRMDNSFTTLSHASDNTPHVQLKQTSPFYQKGVFEGLWCLGCWIHRSDAVLKLVPGVFDLIYAGTSGWPLHSGATVADWLDWSASHQGEPGSIPGRDHSGFSQVGIVPDDAAGRWVSSGISRSPPPPRPFIPALLRARLTSPLVGSQDTLSRAIQISSFTHATPFVSRACSCRNLLAMLSSRALELSCIYTAFSHSSLTRVMASGTEISLDSTVVCILEPQMLVHWLLPHRVTGVTSHLAVWHSLPVSLQVYYWLRVAQGVSNKLRSNCKVNFSVHVFDVYLVLK
ncbi:hypothetical protein PR048_029419 [Dryococelus australis]|uniref:Uncharacterized protein n=1 Tax=Dryococelus australis TaxID=614101 RepID=A0ABQ9GDC2_9NEOP|nr:hypothetical protein PR048_029419 [Dryococelus australis]